MKHEQSLCHVIWLNLLFKKQSVVLLVQILCPFKRDMTHSSVLHYSFGENNCGLERGFMTHDKIRRGYNLNSFQCESLAFCDILSCLIMAGCELP